MKNMKKIMMLLLSFIFIVLVSSCSNNNTSLKRKYDDITITNDKYRNYYEIFVRSFYDTDGDGIGDLKGVTEKLDYVKDLGFNGIWLMPVNKGTSYHKYDVEDYYDIDNEFGTLADMEELIAKCHEKGINIIMDLVVNHTSNRHKWFTTACNNIKAGKTTGQYTDFYNFNTDGGNGYSSVQGTNYHYECQFWSGMPDLNLDSQNVRNEISKIMKFWLDKGVDGFRLDACTSFYTNRTTQNVEFLRWLYGEAKKVKEDVYMVGEAWVTADTNIRKYYDSGVDSFFCFPVAQGTGQIATCLRTNKANPGELFTNVIKNQEQIYDIGILAPFLSNHDTKRAASFFGKDNPEKIKFGYGLLSLMKGATFAYYGDEIGMLSPGEDDPCKRVSFLWDTMDSTGYVTKQPEYKYVTEEQYYYFGSSKKQLEDQNSITNYYKYANYIRNANPEIARGTTANYDYTEQSPLVSVFQRTYNDSTVTIVINLSYDTPVTLKLDKETLKYDKMCQYLCASYDDEVTLSGEEITLPTYSYAILK